MNYIVEEARALLAQATPGPWNDGITEIDAGLYGCTSVVEAKCNTGSWGECGGCELRISKPDRALIAAAPRLLAALADECERLRAENARLREAMIDVAYWERCRAHEDTVEGTYSPYTRDEYAREFHDDLLARLDAAKEVR